MENKTTKSDAQRFTELTDGCWHEFTPCCENGEHTSYCRKCYAEDTKENENPTYDNAADILNRMKEYCGEERYNTFIEDKSIGIVRKLPDCPINVYQVFINEIYILEPSALLRKAVEFLKGEIK